MKLAILDAEVATQELGNDLSDLREFRRSTRSILKGVALIKNLFERNPQLRGISDKKRLGFVVGTSVGEIEITRDFLKDLELTQTARPFLFQLSSHNSTAGFLAQYFSLKGPMLTVSNEYQTAETALESANALVEANHCDAVIVFCVEQVIESWMDLKMYEAHPHLKSSSGAVVLLVGDEVKSGLKAKAILKDFTYGKESLDDMPAGDFYDSNTLEYIARIVGDNNLSARTPASTKYINQSFVRPDKSVTEFSLDV